MEDEQKLCGGNEYRANKEKLEPRSSKRKQWGNIQNFADEMAKKTVINRAR